MTLNNYDVLDEFLVHQHDIVASADESAGVDMCPCVWSNNDCSKCAQFESSKCSFCPMVFLESRARNRHLRASHRSELLDYCMNWFVTREQRCEIQPFFDYRSCSLTPDSNNDSHFMDGGKVMPKDTDKTGKTISTEGYQCEHCSVIVSTKTDIRKHLSAFHPVVMRSSTVGEQKDSEKCTSIYSCSTCGQIFLKKHSFTRHLNSHSSSRYDCDQCQKTFISEYALNIHKDRQHRESSKNVFLLNRKKYLKCELCPFTCRNERNKMEEHMRVHTREKPFTCEKCGKQFRTRALLRVHREFVHEGIKKYACDLCGRCFSNKRYVEEHRRVHTGEKPLICDLCGKTFRQNASLSKHVENHLGIKRHVCNLCDERFGSSYHLSRHIKRHLGELNYACEQCGKKFVDPHELKIHQVVHVDARPFVCATCKATFKLQKHLKQHEKTHDTFKDF